MLLARLATATQALTGLASLRNHLITSLSGLRDDSSEQPIYLAGGCTVPVRTVPPTPPTQQEDFEWDEDRRHWQYLNNRSKKALVVTAEPLLVTASRLSTHSSRSKLPTRAEQLSGPGKLPSPGKLRAPCLSVGASPLPVRLPVIVSPSTKRPPPRAERQAWQEPRAEGWQDMAIDGRARVPAVDPYA